MAAPFFFLQGYFKVIESGTIAEMPLHLTEEANAMPGGNDISYAWLTLLLFETGRHEISGIAAIDNSPAIPEALDKIDAPAAF